jgi:hypothetical protein
MEDQILFFMYYIIQGYHLRSLSMKCDVQGLFLAEGTVNK